MNDEDDTPDQDFVKRALKLPEQSAIYVDDVEMLIGLQELIESLDNPVILNSGFAFDAPLGTRQLLDLLYTLKRYVVQNGNNSHIQKDTQLIENKYLPDKKYE